MTTKGRMMASINSLINHTIQASGDHHLNSPVIRWCGESGERVMLVMRLLRFVSYSQQCWGLGGGVGRGGGLGRIVGRDKC